MTVISFDTTNVQITYKKGNKVIRYLQVMNTHSPNKTVDFLAICTTQAFLLEHQPFLGERFEMAM